MFFRNLELWQFITGYSVGLRISRDCLVINSQYSFSCFMKTFSCFIMFWYVLRTLITYLQGKLRLAKRLIFRRRREMRHLLTLSFCFLFRKRVASWGMTWEWVLTGGWMTWDWERSKPPRNSGLRGNYVNLWYDDVRERADNSHGNALVYTNGTIVQKLFTWLRNRMKSSSWHFVDSCVFLFNIYTFPFQAVFKNMFF
jgi:hypothetical protein